MTLIHLTIAWMAGIALGSWLHPPWTIPIALSVALAASLMLWYQQPLGRRVLALGLVVALGTARWCLAQPKFGPADVAWYAEQQGRLQGTVVGEGERRSLGVVFTLQVEEIELSGREGFPVHGRVLVQAGHFVEVSCGDRVLVEGKLRRPRSGGRFSYRDHLARQGIHVLLQANEEVRHLDGRGGGPLSQALSMLRGWARKRIESQLPEPQASLLVGILLGSRTSMPDEVQEAFSRSGTTHILAISGWNISIVAAFLSAAGRHLLGQRYSLGLVLAGIVLYTLFVGGGAAVLRAAVMGILYVLAQHVGRPGDGITILMASAWAMTLWSPGLLWDIGFQLSLSATIGMLLFVPIWTEAWARWPAFITESMAATLASQLVTWPLMAFYFRQFSLIVPLSNLLACPTLTPLMLVGTLSLFLGAVPGLGFLLRGTTWLLASYMLTVVGWAGRIPWASIDLPVIGPAFLLLYYAGLGWWWWRWSLRRALP
jgi:competence protein ComEC